MDVFYYLTTSHGQRIIDAVADQLTSKRDCSRSPEITRLLEIIREIRPARMSCLCLPRRRRPLRWSAGQHSGDRAPPWGGRRCAAPRSYGKPGPSVVTQSRAP